jgi:hypothetical protein
MVCKVVSAARTFPEDNGVRLACSRFRCWQARFGELAVLALQFNDGSRAVRRVNQWRRLSLPED